MIVRTCTKCGMVKPLAEFHKNKKSIDGHRKICAVCVRAWQSEHYDKTKRNVDADVADTSLKTCSKCGDAKERDCFYRQRNQKDGLRIWCKKCCDAYFLEYKGKNRESIRQYVKEYNARAETKEKRKPYMDAWLKKSPRNALRTSLNNVDKIKNMTDNPVTLDELCQMFEDQRGLCAVSGLPLTWRQGRITPTSMSIDRVDCNGGYTRDNVRLVCYAVNAFRGRMSDLEMLAMARAIISKAEESEPSWKGFGYAAPISTLTVN